MIELIGDAAIAGGVRATLALIFCVFVLKVFFKVFKVDFKKVLDKVEDEPLPASIFFGALIVGVLGVVQKVL